MTVGIHTPLHTTTDVVPWVAPLDLALTLARKALAKHQGANIHSRFELLHAAEELEFALRSLVTSLDAEEARDL